MRRGRKARWATVRTSRAYPREVGATEAEGFVTRMAVLAPMGYTRASGEVAVYQRGVYNGHA